MGKKHLIALSLIFSFATGIYLLTISPTVTWRDAPEFANVSYTLGIAHPAGFPVYSLSAKLLTAIPTGSIPFRVNLFALLACALSILLVYLTINEILTHLNNGNENGSAYIASIACSLFLFVNSIAWQNSLISEVYTFNMFFTVLLIYFAARFSATKEDGFLYSAAFLYGISSGNHGTVAFYLPAFILFYFLEVREKRTAKFLLVCAFFLLGFSAYLYLPIRSLANPSYDWGNPESLSQFISHITDRKTSRAHFAGVKDYSTIIKNLCNYLIVLYKNITIVGIALFFVGAAYLFKKKRSIFYLLFLMLLANTIFFFDWNGGVQLPSYVCYTIFIGIGIFYALERLAEKSLFSGTIRASKLLLYMLLIIMTILGASNYINLSKAHIYTGDEEYKKTFLHLPEKSMVITSYLYFHYKYYQDILGLRKDLTLLGYSDILYPKLFSSINGDKYKNVKIINYDVELTDTAKITKFINLNFNSFNRIFTEIISVFHGMNRFIKYYDGLLFEFTDAKVENISGEEVSRIVKYFNEVSFNFIYEHDYKNDNEADFIYTQDFINCADYILHYGYANSAIYISDTMSKVFGKSFKNNLQDSDAINLKILAGVAYIKKLDFEKGEEIFNGMVKNNERKSEAYNKLGFIYKYKKEHEKSISYYKLAIKDDPTLLDNYLELGGIYETLNQQDKAREVYNNGIKYLFQDEKSVLKSKIDNLKEMNK